MAQRRSRGGNAAPAKSENELAAVMKEVNKRYGDGVLKKGREVEQPIRIPTGVFLIDFCLLGGIPTSRGTMIIGKKHSGKTTLSLKTVSNAQRLFPDQQCVVVDIEGTFDATWAEKLGVNVDDLLVVHPESGEAACDITDALIRTKEVSVVVIDSVAALAPMKEMEGSAEDAHVGLQARMMGALLRKTTAGMIAERRRGHLVTPIYLNQYRAKIGGFSGYGEPLTTPGGMALGFSNTVEIKVTNKETAGKDEHGIDVMSVNEHAFKIEKNKCNGGLRTGEFRLIRTFDDDTGLDEGSIDDAGTMLAFAKKYNAYEGAGSAWTLSFWDEEHKFRGAADATNALYQNGDLYQKLYDYLIWEHAKSLKMADEFLARFTEPHDIDA